MIDYERILSPSGRGLTRELATQVNDFCGRALKDDVAIASLYYLRELCGRYEGIPNAPTSWLALLKNISRSEKNSITCAVGGVLRADIKTLENLRTTPFSELITAEYLGPKEVHLH